MRNCCAYRLLQRRATRPTTCLTLLLSGIWLLVCIQTYTVCNSGVFPPLELRKKRQMDRTCTALLYLSRKRALQLFSHLKRTLTHRSWWSHEALARPSGANRGSVLHEGTSTHEQKWFSHGTHPILQRLTRSCHNCF